MCMGPARAFPEYFPPEFDYEAFDQKIRKDKKKKSTSRCKTSCAGNQPIGPFHPGLQCEFTTHIPINYLPQYLKSHERYCGCRDDLCPNKRTVASHEECQRSHPSH